MHRLDSEYFRKSQKYNFLKVFFIIVAFSFAYNISLAGIREDKCQSFDYSDRFGPIRDQDGHGYCYAFSAAALVEEHLCKHDREKCGKSISALDISRCEWTLNVDLEKEGGSEGNSLNCALYNGGVCLEKDAPYDALTDLDCSLWDILSHEGAHCKNKKVAALYTRWQQNCAALNNGTANLQSFAEIQKALVNSLKEKVPEQFLTGKHITSIFYESKSESDFLKKILIPKSCENNRIPVNAKIEQMISAKENAMEKNVLVNFVAKGLRENSSVAISLDLGSTGWHNYKKDSFHSLAVTGMRFNEWTKKCEFQLRNSHGEGAHFNGWYPVDDVEKGIIRARYLRDN